MPRIVRTARGELVDFDMVIVKQQISEAPMNIEVQRRKEFIDNKEGRSRKNKLATDDNEVDEEVIDEPIIEGTSIPEEPTEVVDEKTPKRK